jgi:N4-gp56 family major capsid protein
MTTYGDISQRTAAWAADQMLAHAEPIIVLGKFGQGKPVPRNKADTVKFRRPVPFAAVTAPLTEGVTPAAQTMAYEDVQATLDQWGAVVQITDRVNDLCEDPVLSDATTLCGEQAAETVELLTWGVLKGGTSVFYANESATPVRDEVNQPISIEKLHKAVRYLQAQRAKRITRILSGSPDSATKPIEAAFVAFGHTDMEHDLRALPGFTPVAAYGSRQPLCPEELGSVENMRFILSPLLAPWLAAGSDDLQGMISSDGDKVDVYPLVIVGQDAYGLVTLKGSSAITPSVVNPDTKTKYDPLGQFGFVGWKTYFTAVRLNETWMTRIECGVTAL